MNQTTQMRQIARHLVSGVGARRGLPGGSWQAWFTPYNVDGALEIARRVGLLDATPPGRKLQSRCLAYLRKEELAIDEGGRRGDYDLVVACSDLHVPQNVRDRPMVLVQEGILDPLGLRFEICRRWSLVPRWIAGTAATGLSGQFDRFCVASHGDRDLFVQHGVDASRIVVTGIPNFDDCARFLDNDFPHRGYVLVCTSDARDTLKLLDNRMAFLRWAQRIAGDRPMIFKLHPNENVVRATREIGRVSPGALVYSQGCAEHMIANCDALVTQYSSTVFVGIALGREVHSYYDMDHLRALSPLQNGRAARNIAAVCEELVGERGTRRAA